MSQESGARASTADLRARLRAAYLGLLKSYAEWGGYCYYGWTHHSDPKNYYGPAVWSEADCVHRFAIELERTFPGWVHTELRINKAMVASYEANSDPRQAIDIVISNSDQFEEDENSQERFRTKRHEIFIEAKWLKKGRWTKAGEHLKRATNPHGGIVKDLSNLKGAQKSGRCLIAGMLVFDDECFLDYHGDRIEWPSGVEKLIVSPTQLQRRKLGSAELTQSLAEIKRLHAENCALCRPTGLKLI